MLRCTFDKLVLLTSLYWWLDPTHQLTVKRKVLFIARTSNINPSK